MNRLLNISRFPQLFVLAISVIPLMGILGIPVISNTFLTWVYNFLILYVIYKYRKYCFRVSNRQDYRLIGLFLLIALIGAIRGAFIAENYWEYKSLVHGIFCTSLPVFTYIFSSASMMQRTLYYWLKYFMPLWLLLGMWMVVIDGWHFYISPLLILGCFLPIIRSKLWRWMILFFLFVMLVGDIGARAQMMKACMVLLVAFGIYLRRRIPIKVLKIAHVVLLVSPVILLVLGITGVFNIFQENSDKNSGKYVQTQVVNGQIVQTDASADTRTFIYYEVITSALRHHYVLWGRSLARGNDSVSFGTFTAEKLKTGKYERHMNEVCHPNIFTWLGLLGMIPWCLIYIYSSWLAIYRSNNIYMKYIGVYIAFRFFLGWIEDVNSFNISGISVWILIAMGLSEQFRMMTSGEFRHWTNHCFPKIMR